MRYFFTLGLMLILLSVSRAYAQIEITYSDMANDGDGYIYAVRTFRVGELSLQELNRKGWDVSGYVPDTYDTVRYYNKRRSKQGKLFPNSELVRFQTKKNMEFITMDSTKIRMQGLINDYLGLKAAVVIVFPTDLTMYKFPLRQGSYISDSISKKFVSSYGLSQFADSVRIDLDMRTESYFDTCLTIKTPQDTYEALRERNYIYKNMVAYKNSHLMGWRPAPEFSTKTKAIYYRWYAKGAGIPVLEVETDNFDNVRFIRYQYRAPMEVAIEKEDVKCHGQKTGVAKAVVSGGTPDYKYLWSNGKTTKEIKDLPAGEYSVTVTDCKGNVATQKVVITQPKAPLELRIDFRDIRCYGEHDAYLKALVSGGTEPYYIVWSNDLEVPELVNQGTGVYGCVVRDANRCFVWDSVEVRAPGTSFTFSPAITHSPCHGEARGELRFDVHGGDRPYRFWLDGKECKEEMPDIMAGTYTMKATDKWGCTLERTAEVKQPEKPMDATAEIKHVTCHGGNNGGITLKVTGGTPGYTYTWSNEATSRDVGRLGAGEYKLTIHDAIHCTLSKSFVITEPSEPLSMQCDVTHVSTHGGNNGMIKVTPHGGQSPYRITLNNKEKTPIIERLKMGSYSVKVEDKNDCSVIETIIISEQGAED